MFLAARQQVSPLPLVLVLQAVFPLISRRGTKACPTSLPSVHEPLSPVLQTVRDIQSPPRNPPHQNRMPAY